MPFKRIGPDKYQSPSGRTFTKNQVLLYHANNGFPKKGEKRPTKPPAKQKK